MNPSYLLDIELTIFNSLLFFLTLSVLGFSGKALAKPCVQKAQCFMLPLCLHPVLYGSFFDLHIDEPSQSGQFDFLVLWIHIRFKGTCFAIVLVYIVFAYDTCSA